MNRENANATKNHLIGVWYAVAAFLTWGILPLYWKLLQQVPPLEILTHRIFWSFVFVAIMVTYHHRWDRVKNTFTSPQKKLLFLLASILLSANWFLYIWAVNSNHIIESSMGYYINPLLSVLLGILFLRERLNFWQIVSLCFAFIGVAVITLEYGKIPWIALSLALTFGFYGLVKKFINAESLIGLTLETMVIVPFAAGYIFWKQAKGIGALGTISIPVTLLLILAGIVTALPLLWFAKATNRVPLSTVGFIQYLTPTITLILGVFLYHEPFSKAHLLSFGFIWVALLIFSCSQLDFSKINEIFRTKFIRF